MFTTLEQVKAMENIVASGQIIVDEATQLWELYIIKLKLVVCMLKTTVNKILGENKAHVDFITETKGDDIR